MSMDSLADLLQDELKDLYSAEKQLVQALPKMAKKASSEALKKAFSDHLAQTKGHVERLDKVAKLLQIKLGGKKCKAMEGLVEEGKEVIEEDGDDSVIDAALIGAAQRVEHYEIAAYGTARALAEAIGESEVVELLQPTLDEEGETDKRLTEISENEIIPAAKSAGGEDEEEEEE
jgi:ferritin-like metal-binding protein YciE